MKILITSIVDPKKSYYSRMHAFAQYLSQKHSVTILSVNDSWKGKQSSIKKYDEEYGRSISGIDIVYMTEKEQSLVGQELFSKKSIKKFLSQHGPFDLILDYNTLSIGRRTQELMGGVNRIYDIADDLVDMVRTSSQMPRIISPLAARYASGLITKSIRSAQMVTATTAALLDRFEVPAAKRQVIPNGIPSTFFGELSEKEIIDSRQEPDEFLIGYVGVLREWVNFEPIFHAMKTMQSKTPIRLIIIGEEGDKGRIRAQMEAAGVSGRVSMLGTVPHDQIRNYLIKCDCGIIPFAMTSTSEFALPLKLFEYLSVGLPVISTPIKAIKENFSDIVWFYEDAQQLVKAITDITSNSQVAKMRAEEGMKIVESKYTWNGVLQNLESLIENLAVRNQ